MRTTALLSLAVLATACAPEPLELRHEFSLAVDTSGHTMLNESRAWAGMLGTTCEVDVRSETIGMDIDPTGTDEQVVGGGEVQGMDLVLTKTRGSVQVLDVDMVAGDLGYEGLTNTEMVDVHSLSVEGVASAGFTASDALVTVAQNDAGCAIAWRGVDGSVSTLDLDEAVCETDRSMDFFGEAPVVVVDGMVALASPEGLTELAPGQLGAAGVELVAVAHEGELSGVQADGAIAWTLPVEGTVAQVESLGSRGLFVAAIEHADGTAALIMVDGLTGTVEREVPLPAVAPFDVSPGGRTLAFDTGDRVHYHRVH